MRARPARPRHRLLRRGAPAAAAVVAGVVLLPDVVHLDRRLPA